MILHFSIKRKAEDKVDENATPAKKPKIDTEADEALKAKLKVTWYPFSITYIWSFTRFRSNLKSFGKFEKTSPRILPVMKLIPSFKLMVDSVVNMMVLLV